MTTKPYLFSQLCSSMELAIQTTKTKSRLAILESILHDSEHSDGETLKDTVDVLSGMVRLAISYELDLQCRGREDCSEYLRSNHEAISKHVLFSRILRCFLSLCGAEGNSGSKSCSL